MRCKQKLNKTLFLNHTWGMVNRCKRIYSCLMLFKVIQLTSSHVTLYTSTTHNTVSLQNPGTLLQRDSELIHNSKRFYKDS